jgi:hypothetical protein
VRAKRDAFEAFRRTMPQALCRIVEPFESHQWLMLHMIHHSPAGRELAENNPVLAYALANSHEFRRTPPEVAAVQAVMHSHDRQRDISAWLGYPGTPAMVRVFKKLSPEAATPSILRLLRNTIGKDASRLRVLQHRRHINAGVLDFILIPDLMELATPSLLDEIENSADELQFSAAADRLAHAITVLKDIRSRREVRPFRSLRQIEGFVEAVDAEYLEHQRRMEELRAARRAAHAARERQRAELARQELDSARFIWPPPPLSGTESIVPISSYDMLRKEGKSQRNCIAGYWRSIAGEKPRYYAYRVLKPQRATLMIVKRAGGSWMLQEAKVANNKPISDKTHGAIAEWLYGQSLAY